MSSSESSTPSPSSPSSTPTRSTAASSPSSSSPSSTPRSTSSSNTTRSPPPATTPPGSSTPTTPPPDEPTSTDDPPTTTPPDDDSTTPPTTTPPTTTPPPTTTTEVTRTTTLPDGQVTQIITTIVIVPGGQSTVTSIVTDGGDPNNSGGGGGGGGGSDHTGTIVGATVGGVIAVAVALLLWFVVARKRRDRAHKAFDGDIFNPDHTLRGPNFDLGGPPAPETIPVPYTFDDDPGAMREAYPHPQGVYPQQAYYAPSDGSNTTPGMAGLGAAGLVGAGAGAYAMHHHQQQHPLNGTPGYPTSESAASSAGDRSSQPLMGALVGGAGRTSPASSAPLSGRAAKEREAFARTNAQRASMVMSPPGGGGPAYLGPASAGGPPSAPSQYSSDGSHSGSSPPPHPYSPTRQSFAVANPDGPQMPLPNPYDQPVLVHQDAGRVPQSPPAAEDEEREIPPTYDSIPLDEDARRRFSGPAAVPLPSSQHGHSESAS